MGLSSASNESIQLCIFDLRRGQNEGQELDKILFFFPSGLPFSKQLSVIGLSEGLITFTRFCISQYHNSTIQFNLIDSIFANSFVFYASIAEFSLLKLLATPLKLKDILMFFMNLNRIFGWLWFVTSFTLPPYQPHLLLSIMYFVDQCFINFLTFYFLTQIYMYISL